MNMRTKEEIEKYFSAHLCIKNIDIKDVIEIISSNAFFNWFNKENNKKEILVPSDIHIIKNDNSQQLGIGFNKYKQVLSFNKEIDSYQVLPVTKYDYLQQCKLVLCKHEDIKVGDIFTTSYAISVNELSELDSYLIKLSEKDICFIQDSNCAITSYYEFEDYAIRKIDFYKLVEIDKIEL